MFFDVVDVLGGAVAGQGLRFQFFLTDIGSIFGRWKLAVVCDTVFINPVIDFRCGCPCKGKGGE